MNMLGLNLIGLIVSGFGGILLAVCPPVIPANEIMPDGREKYPMTFVRTQPNLKLGMFKYLWRYFGFKAGAWSLAAGLFMQIMANVK